MRVVVASGKGGAGKTSVATSLAYVAAQDRHVAYLDCDVEAPNGAIFLKPAIMDCWQATVAVPKLDRSLCTNCGKCERICQSNALVSVNGKLLLFPALCHGCGGCWLVCRTGALQESARAVGTIMAGDAEGIYFRQGLMNIGEASSPAIIREVKRDVPEHALVIVDAPPGVTCPAIESVRNSDFVILVAESTLFGLHDLRLAVSMLRSLGLPFGVVINRATPNNEMVDAFCRQEDVAVLARVPEDRSLAEAYSRGEILSSVSRDYFQTMEGVLVKLDEMRVDEDITTRRELPQCRNS